MNLTETISETFDIGPIISITPIDAGFLTENQLVETVDKKYFLKGHRGEVAEHISYVEEVEQFFTKGDIPVITPIATKDGKLHFIHEGKTYTLYPLVEGIQAERGRLTENQLKSLGENLARMHLLSKEGIPKQFTGQEVNAWDKEKTLDKLKKTEELINNKETLSDFDKLALEHIALKRDFVLKNTSQYHDFNLSNDTLTHGDYHERNVFFTEEGGIKHIFDFEMAKIGPRHNELVRSLMLICFPFGEKVGTKDFEDAGHYLRGYHSIFPINKEIFDRVLDAFKVKSFHSIWVETEYYLKGNTKIGTFLSPQIARNRYFSESFEEFKKHLETLLE